jgi:hypothetical protein
VRDDRRLRNEAVIANTQINDIPLKAFSTELESSAAQGRSFNGMDRSSATGQISSTRRRRGRLAQMKGLSYRS